MPARLPACPQAARFARAHLYDEASGRLRRAFMRGPSAVQAFADDYAYLISGLLDLHSASGDVAHLQARVQYSWLAAQLACTTDSIGDVLGARGFALGGGPSRCVAPR